MQNNKMKKLTEHIHALEEKLQYAFNENAKLRVKQKEDEKLWKGLESKFTSTKTLCDQLTETLQHLAGQVHDGRFSLFIFFFLTLGLIWIFLRMVSILYLVQQLRKTRNSLKISYRPVHQLLIICTTR